MNVNDFMQLLFSWIPGTFIVFYWVTVLLIPTSLYPFGAKASNKMVRYDSTDGDVYMWYVGWFDRFRQIFGLYHVTDTEWVVRKERSTVWSCPVCLGFWVSLVVSLAYGYLFQDIFICILTWNVLAGVNAYLFQGGDE